MLVAQLTVDGQDGLVGIVLQPQRRVLLPRVRLFDRERTVQVPPFPPSARSGGLSFICDLVAYSNLLLAGEWSAGFSAEAMLGSVVVRTETGAKGTIAEWRAWLLARGRSPATVNRYEPLLHRLEAQQGPLLDLETEQIAEWLATVDGEPPTVAKAVSAVGSYYGFLVMEGLRRDDPTTRLHRPRIERRQVDKEGEDMDARIARLPAPFDAIATIILETGVQISELERDRIWVGRSEIVVLGRRDRKRSVPLSAAGRSALLLVLALAHLPSRRTIERRFRREAAITPRELRHARAQRWLAEGWDLATIQDWLGHRSRHDTRSLRASGDSRSQAQNRSFLGRPEPLTPFSPVTIEQLPRPSMTTFWSWLKPCQSSPVLRCRLWERAHSSRSLAAGSTCTSTPSFGARLATSASTLSTTPSY